MIDRACISINSKCNLSCKYCHFSNNMNLINSKHYEFTSDEIELVMTNLINYINENKIPKFKLGIVGSGEPVLNFDTIVHIVEQIKNSKIYGNIAMYTITNGTLLTEDQLGFFYKNRDIIALNFSLDGDKEVHEVLRSNFDKTYRNILKYEELFGEKPLINCVVTKKTIENKESLLKFFLENNFKKINFSILFGIDVPELTVSKYDYDQFLNECSNFGLVMRQKSIELENIHDCAKYGRLCGVGKTNIFITKTGIYPCGRFINNSKYRLALFNDNLYEVEKNLIKLTPVAKGDCYYDIHKIGEVR